MTSSAIHITVKLSILALQRIHLSHPYIAAGHRDYPFPAPLTLFSICSLKQHRPVHTGEKPFTCRLCNKSFRFHSNLCDHISVHAEDALRWQCPFCEKCCRLKGNLFKHFKTHFADVQQRLQAWKQSFPAVRTGLNLDKVPITSRANKCQPAVRGGEKIRRLHQACSRPIAGKRLIKVEKPKPQTLARAEVRANVGTFVCTLCSKKFAWKRSLRRHAQQCLAKRLRSLKAIPRSTTPTECVKPEPDMDELHSSPVLSSKYGDETIEAEESAKEDYTELSVGGSGLKADATVSQAKMGPKSKPAASDAPNPSKVLLHALSPFDNEGASALPINVDVANGGRNAIPARQLHATRESRLQEDQSAMEMGSANSSSDAQSKRQAVGTSDLQAVDEAEVTFIRYRRLDGTLLEKTTDAERLLTFGEFRTMFELPEGAKVSFKKLNPGKHRRSALWLIYDKDYQLIPLVDGRDTIEAEGCQQPFHFSN